MTKVSFYCFPAASKDREDEPPAKEQASQHSPHAGSRITVVNLLLSSVVLLTTSSMSIKAARSPTSSHTGPARKWNMSDEVTFVDREVGTDPMAVCYQGY